MMPLTNILTALLHACSKNAVHKALLEAHMQRQLGFTVVAAGFAGTSDQ